MYTLNENQIASLLVFEGKIPDSMIKSKVEKWIAEITPTQRVTGEQMEQLVAFSTHLPKELQNFPQSFALAAKNLPETERREAKEENVVSADLVTLVDESIENVADADAPDNEEETLHKLGTKEKKKSKDKSKK